jgi:hypothetical protein
MALVKAAGVPLQSGDSTAVSIPPPVQALYRRNVSLYHWKRILNHSYDWVR